VGLPADFEERSQSSLGLQLVSGLAMQIGGELQTGPLARFCIRFAVVEPGPLAVTA
jgi:two-component sensor histidine kinase